MYQKINSFKKSLLESKIIQSSFKERNLWELILKLNNL